jgi:hypothetical protein
MKLVINDRHGGFGLSRAAVMRYAEIKGITLFPEDDTEYRALGIVHYWLVPAEQRIEYLDSAQFYALSQEQRIEHNKACAAQQLTERDIERNDPVLVQVVEELGDAASGKYSHLTVVEIPDDVKWEIEEYDGKEWVAEVHRTWY